VGLWIPRALFVLVPVFAVLVSAVTRSAGRNYPQDLYFALHTHAAIFAFLAVAALAAKARQPRLDDLLTVLAFAYATWYVILAFRTAYGGSWRRSIGRAAVVGLLYGLAILLAIVVVALLAVVV
jgi:hypothetical protein